MYSFAHQWRGSCILLSLSKFLKLSCMISSKWVKDWLFSFSVCHFSFASFCFAFLFGKCCCSDFIIVSFVYISSMLVEYEYEGWSTIQQNLAPRIFYYKSHSFYINHNLRLCTGKLWICRIWDLWQKTWVL